ncbi:MAG: hypothetical protein ACI82A_004069 [Candidatus Azotimanducaceae bacterium]|jgi:hypothetical protein
MVPKAIQRLKLGVSHLFVAQSLTKIVIGCCNKTHISQFGRKVGTLQLGSSGGSAVQFRIPPYVDINLPQISVASDTCG